jgi:hypothetical protein
LNLEIDRVSDRTINWGKVFVDRFESPKHRQQRELGEWLDHQALAFFPQDRFPSGQLQIAWDPDGLIAAVPKQSNVSLCLHGALPLHAYAKHLLLASAPSRTAGRGRRPMMRTTRWKKASYAIPGVRQKNRMLN